MSATRASAKYSKKDGHLTISDDTKHVFWTPSEPVGASPAVTIAVADITNLQQTPATSKSIALKVVVTDGSHVFTFSDKQNARQEQERVTETLRNVITANKAQATAQHLAKSTPTTTTTAAAKNASSQAAAAPAASSIPTTKAAEEEGWYDDNQLKSDDKLQRSLLESNKGLSERFNQSLKDKPPTLSFLQLTRQFWSSRLHLLRAHAIETAQKQGEYNVLPEIKFIHKPAEKEGEPGIKQLQITKEQIKLIFKQYPVVLEAYNACCPPLSAGQFWEKFFASRLLKKLKGEKIRDTDPRDSLLDKYLDRTERTGPASIGHVPHFIDLEGNEQNHSQKLGNRPDQDMRPNKVPILTVLNNLSEKMLSHVAPEDGEAHGPIGMDEETFDQLRLRDLAMEDVDNRVVLNVKEQQRYVGGNQDDLSADAKRYALQDPTQVLTSINAHLQPSHFGADERGAFRLDQVLGFQAEEDDDDDDEGSHKQPTIGSHAAIKSTTDNLLSAINTRRQAAASDPTHLRGLSQSTFDTLQITHNTTTEFLHYFWTLFLSGDARKTDELEHLVSTLDRSLDRINAVADVAEKEYQVKVDGYTERAQAAAQRSGKKFKLGNVDRYVGGGGRKVVDAMVRPTVVALGEATGKYRKVLEEQTREAAAAGA
ncbi:related to RNA polymerase II transcription initiation/nucleotide excision repair factor TFIIH, subunit TFB1 [Ramularia collo-cygni]|uniref:Related to RNA polymerase II transcription initiation/nucleotide excision repair factor TFIIH, subunit TFB1 n=1 Tax=Ramularia collo-cygni TaxID=112498 RepID=A0A2D3UXR1_9PEZI|nr:related to RNA polymerase II transcription initiation/nucleotide excision repair factor TFIIH, subunit TFB1 [Ramularia collo-cygni]CZT20218.1 related to RNA polymerase II transcription initiation/nucleotide excision repair factor TFIIH, subunit TFB1 [Ramularia collo-cygni]